MRGTDRRTGAPALLVLALVVLGVMLMPAAGSAAHKGRPAVGAAKPGMGPAHWFGPHGRYGTFGKKPELFRPQNLFAVDNLVNPSNNEIMPTTNTYLIFWLPTGFHYSNGTTAATDTAYENQIIK